MTESPLEKKAGNAPEVKPAVADADAQAVPVRASDADRDRIADILREALAEGRLDTDEHSDRIEAAYRAKTVAELEPLVRDLPAGRPESGAAKAPEAARYEWAAAPEGSAKDNVVAVFSGSVRKGRYRVPRKINAVACFGGVEIDLTEAVFEQQHVQINATAVFGGVEVRVPENVTLRQKGAGIFGGFDVRTSEAEDPRAPVVLVQGAAVFGGVEAKPKRGKRLRDLRERLRKEL